MTQEDTLRNRAQALEEMFFSQLSKQRIEAMRASIEAEETAGRLAKELGLTDAALVRHLVNLGISPETLFAFSLVPLIHVANADGLLDKDEQEAILAECLALGMDAESDSSKLLQSWLEKPGSSKLFDAWKELYSVIAPTLSPRDRAHLIDDLSTRMQRVARASGGFLGLGAESKVEAAAIQEVLDVLHA